MISHAGIVACSPPGAALCWEIVSTGASELMARFGVPFEVSMNSPTLASYMRSIATDDWRGVADLMLASAHKLHCVGAQLLIAPCNTIHYALDLVIEQSPLPWLNIADEVAKEARRLGFRKVGVLGTKLIMESDIYSARFERQGVQYCIPEGHQREWLGEAILSRMVHGQFTHDDRTTVATILSTMKATGCDAVGLCCTELPILLRGIDSPVPLLDSIDVLARSALQMMSGERTL